jgi:hypothetical protein
LTTQRFKTILAKSGSKTVLPIPFDPNAVWGDKPRHHITGTINNHAVRGPLDFDGTQFFLPLSPAWRRDNGLDAGAKVDVVLSPEGPQVEALAPDIAAALEAEPQARAFFEGLATFYRKGYLKWIDGARRPEIRAARIAEMVELLKAGQKQRQ